MATLVVSLHKMSQRRYDVVALLLFSIDVFQALFREVNCPSKVSIIQQLQLILK